MSWVIYMVAWIVYVLPYLVIVHGQVMVLQPTQTNVSERVINKNSNITEKDIIDMILGEQSQYDNRLRPMGYNDTARQYEELLPVSVIVNIYLRSISKIDDVNMEYSCQITFREQWMDQRLQYNESYGLKYVMLPDPERIWRPDLFFANEKQGHFHDIVMPNVLLRLYPDGKILYSVRISLVLSCQMRLEYYPLDKQFCSLDMASYGYTTDDIVFIWKNEKPVQKKEDFELPSFTLGEVKTVTCLSVTNTGAYSCLKVSLELKRQFSYYLLQLYIPSYMLVIVSWVSFWLDKEAVPARVSLGVTTLLTMATQASGINSKLPPVSYTKAIDVWIGSCLTFIFGALLEFALVNYAGRRDMQEAAQRAKEQKEAVILDMMEDGCTAVQMKPLFNNSDNNAAFRKRTYRDYDARDVHIDPSKKPKRKGLCGSFLSRYKDRSKRIDVFSRIMFPTGFCLFNIIYWTGYLFGEGSIIN